jgi:hypothetical protein
LVFAAGIEKLNDSRSLRENASLKLVSAKDYQMNKRPLSITIIAWLFIIFGVLSAVAIPFTLGNPMTRELMAKSMVPVPVQYFMMFAGLLVSILAGIFMLRGANWARMLYIIWGALGFLFSLITSPAKLVIIPGFLVYLIVVFFLLRPKATAFFTGSNHAQPS